METGIIISSVFFKLQPELPLCHCGFYNDRILHKLNQCIIIAIQQKFFGLKIRPKKRILKIMHLNYVIISVINLKQ